jgi:hypothetical protein
VPRERLRTTFEEVADLYEQARRRRTTRRSSQTIPRRRPARVDRHLLTHFRNVATRRYLWDATYSADEYLAVLNTSRAA